MPQLDSRQSSYGLQHHGIINPAAVWWNLSTPSIYEEVVRHREGLIAHLGPLVVRTGHYTGRSPKDKFIVEEPGSRAGIWWGEANHPMSEGQYQVLRSRLLAYLQGKEIFVRDCFVVADPALRMPIRVITEKAWHNLFAHNMFIQAQLRELQGHVPELTLICAPHFHAVPEVDGTNSEAFIVINFAQKTILIGGTSYAGEMKKSVFSALTYYLPPKGVLPMHCAANSGPDGATALFFGLSGTGKTSLSTSADRTLIGDDEHGWGDNGIFNFEGGCYAKAIRLSTTAEPEIYQTTRRFGTILENVFVDPSSRRLNLDDDSVTENTRACYPISHLANATRSGIGSHPSVIFMLTADAFGVLPPIARLTSAQAMYHFISGYTAKVAGTERGVSTPSATFSACYGSPFMTRHPSVYATLLAEKVQRHNAQVWLVNTGWTGGTYGVGSRMKIGYTRAMVRAALTGRLAGVPTERDPVFGVQVPLSCPMVPPEVLIPRKTWQDQRAYDEQSRILAQLFRQNFKKFADQMPDDVKAVGPELR